MKKTFRKTLAYLLCFLLIFTSLPLVAAAENATVQNKVENTDVNKPTEEPYIISELIEKRESNVKHFRMSDGSINAVVYSKDVHFKNESNEFIDIDNSLQDGIDESDNIYANKTNIASVKFMKKSNLNKLYTINKGDYKIKVSIEGVSKVNGVAKTSESDILSKTQFTLENIGSKITYNDILKNTDFEYTLFSTELKENIILKEKVDYNNLIYSYHFNGSVDAIQEDEKNISVYEKESNNLIFNISAPVIWDAANNYYDDITIEIIENKNSEIKVKLSWNIDNNAVYPVTVDPVMHFQTVRNNIQDTHIIKSYPTTNYDYNNHIRVRNDGYSLLKFPLPELKSGDKIINAQFSLFPYGYFDNSLDIYSNANSFNPKLQITTHKVLREWNEKTATYSNLNPDNNFYENIVQSFHEVGSDNSFYTWDITRLANDWTEGRATNYGILLKYAAPPSDGSMFDAFFCSTNGKYIDSNAWPQVIYQYINTNGVEDYFSYQTQSVGRAGDVYVNNLTGNLTVLNPVLQTGGQLTPINVSFVYNSNDATGNATPYGRGWKLNWSQKLDRTMEDDFGYIVAKYTDEDGTDRYLNYNYDTGVFIDEIDPKRKIIWIDSTTYSLSDSNGGEKRFKRYGSEAIWYLYEVRDEYGNKIQITRNSSNYERIDKITSTGGYTVDFVYNSSGYLTKLKYYDNEETKEINIQYSSLNQSLQYITFADNKQVEYQYYNSTTYPCRIIDTDGTRAVFGYTWSNAMRVVFLEIGGADASALSRTEMKYHPTSTLLNDKTNNRNYLYSFSANGTLKNVLDITQDDGNSYSILYEYNNNSSNLKGMNNLTAQSKLQKNTVNIIKDHSFENSSSGEINYQSWTETAGSSSAEYSSVKSHTGAHSYKLYRSADNTATRTLGYFRHGVVAGQKYTLSAYVNTANMISQGKGVNLFVIASSKQFESEYILNSKDEWQRISLSFIAPATEAVSICLNMSQASGSVYFDSVQLEKGDLSEYNYVKNAGFETFASVAEGWTNWGGLSFKETSTVLSDSTAVRLEGVPATSKEYYQFISVPNGKSGDTYVASAFGKAFSASSKEMSFSFLVRFMKNGATVNQTIFKFDSYITEWQKAGGAIKASGDYDTIIVFLLYYSNCNSACFDNVQLIKDNFGASYTYDSNGNLISTVDLQNKESNTFQYDGKNQLIKQTNVGGGKIDYTYDSSKKQQLNSVSSGGVITDYTYDSFGNALTSTTYGENTNKTPKITSSASYSTNGEYLTTITDSRGKTESYEYNEDRGYLKSSTNAKGITTNYEYYPNELIKKATVGSSSVNYSYDSANRLQTITSPSATNYNFTYDTFNRKDTIKVGDQLLSDYGYNSRGLLDTMLYGNGTVISYGYDNLNRQTSLKVNNTLRYNFIYDSFSRVNVIEDILAGKLLKYEYDILERPVLEKIINNNTKNIIAQLDIRYDDSKNRVAGYSVNVEGLTKITDFVYGELTRAPEIITGVKQDNTRILTYGYDSLNRLSSRTLATQSPFVTEYTYLPGASSDKTTALVKSIKNGDDTISYTYDDLGNITSISKNGSLEESYTYDNLNQLKTVAKGTDTFEYTYDNGGNILSVKKNGVAEKSYTYNDSEWKDLLTAYNGQTITYDNIGNPISYRDGMSFTWADGRKLSTITKGTDNISYTYDANGLRTSKTVNGVKTEYYWLNGMLQGQKTGNEHIIFLYGENGMAYGFLVYENGIASGEYYYIFNAQGDIIGIIDSQGAQVVEYTYNAWGELLSITGTLADTIGQKNPLRYRGYYFDSETGLYYVSSRYYDPEVMRFINADGYVSTGQGILGTNMFAYCGNNPVNYYDPTGEISILAVLGIGALVVGIAVFFSSSDVDTVTQTNESLPDNFVTYSEHQKKGTTNPSNRNKHQKGQARKQRDNNGEKKNNNPNWKPNPNKRRVSTDDMSISFGERVIFGSIAVGSTAAVVYFMANDLTGVGAADDWAIPTLIPIIWDNAAKAIS